MLAILSRYGGLMKFADRKLSDLKPDELVTIFRTFRKEPSKEKIDQWRQLFNSMTPGVTLGDWLMNGEFLELPLKVVGSHDDGMAAVTTFGPLLLAGRKRVEDMTAEDLAPLFQKLDFEYADALAKAQLYLGFVKKLGVKGLPMDRGNPSKLVSAFLGFNRDGQFLSRHFECKHCGVINQLAEDADDMQFCDSCGQLNMKESN